MFNKFANILNQAVEALAPQATAHQEFVQNWKSITHFFVDNKDGKCPIERTNIPKHLEQMLSILLREETTSETGSTGPCMEYLLQHKLLDTLYTLGRTDHPPGMKQHVLMFFTKLLSRIKQPLLPHVSVYRAVHKLVRVCGEVKAAPTENEEIQFLCNVCAKIKSDPYLVNFFIEMPKPAQLTRTGQVLTPERKNPEFHLIQSLLSLSNSEDGRIAVKACEGLMLCVSLRESYAATCVVNHTTFCRDMTDKLNNLYRKLPKFMDPADIDITEANWGLDMHTDSSDCHNFAGKRQLLSFLSWLDFLDQLIFLADAEIADALSTAVREKFLGETVQQAILQSSESGCMTSISLLTRCVRLVQSAHLLTAFTDFILGEESASTDHDQNYKVRNQLLQKCDHLSDEVTVAALHLFEMLILKYDDKILHRLILKPLLSRAYRQQESLVNGVHEPNDQEKSDESPEVLLSEDSGSGSQIEDSLSEQEQLIVPSFLGIVGDEFKSSTNTAESGYDTYLRDAHRQFSACQSHCEQFGWPSTPVNEANTADAEQSQEGAFLKVLLDKLSRMLDQTYNVNLQVTSVIAKLAVIPHPNLHEFLLDAFLPLAPNCRSLVSVLNKVSADIQVRSHRSGHADFTMKLVNLRKNLLGEADALNRKRHASSDMIYCAEDQNLLGSVIVLEEFCKELAAIAFVKQHQKTAAARMDANLTDMDDFDS